MKNRAFQLGFTLKELMITKVILYAGGSGTSSTSSALIKSITGLGSASFKGRVSWREIIKD
jgi:hypothetical protein